MCKEHVCYIGVYEPKGTISILSLHFYMQVICCSLVSVIVKILDNMNICNYEKVLPLEVNLKLAL
jgi:hypothetical protein